MKGTGPRYKIKMVRGCLTSIGIAVLLGTGVCARGAQEKQRRPLVVASRQATAGSEKVVGRPVLQRRNPRYELCKGDTFDLTFSFTPEFNQTVTIQPDGYITLASVGDLYVAGKTIPELRELLLTAYAGILHDAVINVVLKDFEKPYFVAAGEVGHPGKYDLRGDTTVVQAVAIAGGFTDRAKHSQVLLFRRTSNDWVEVKKVNVKQLLHAQNLQEDLHLRPGDMLFVPKSALSKIERYIPRAAMGLYLDPTRF